VIERVLFGGNRPNFNIVGQCWDEYSKLTNLTEFFHKLDEIWNSDKIFDALPQLPIGFPTRDDHVTGLDSISNFFYE